MRITFLSRPGCHLCEAALIELDSHLATMRENPSGLSLEEVSVDVVNIELDDELHRRYLERIPVVLIGPEVVSDLTFDPERLDAALTSRLEGKG